MKKLTKKVLPIVLAGTMVIGMAMPAMAAETTGGKYDADLIEKEYEWEAVKNDAGEVEYYQVKNVSYVAEESTRSDLQQIHIYVPAAYINEDGTMNTEEKIGDYNAETAPIVLFNFCSGWNSSNPANAGKAGADMDCLDAGFIYVFAGARSRDAGFKAPTPVVDLKSVVRYLKLNDEAIPGDSERIISTGSSGAGQMSAVLGSTGNMEDYYAYLYDNGAAGIAKDASGNYVSTIGDDIWGTMCYRPITDIENQDIAYAWMRAGDKYEQNWIFTGPGPLKDPTGSYSEFQKDLEKDLADAYVDYLNSLEINGLTLNADGTGSYYDQICQNLSDALNIAIAAGNVKITDLTDTDKWLEEQADGTWKVTNIAEFINATNLRPIKNITGYDCFDLSGENSAFGTDGTAGAHFSASVAQILYDNKDAYAAKQAADSTYGYDVTVADDYYSLLIPTDAATQLVDEQTYLMNATHLMLDIANGDLEGVDVSPYYRVRHGSADEHASFSIAYNLAMAAKAAGSDVDYAMEWDMTHFSPEKYGSFVEWVKEICPVEDNSNSNPPAGDGGTTPQKPTSPQTGAGMSMLPMVIASVAAVAGASLKRREIR